MPSTGSLLWMYTDHFLNQTQNMTDTPEYFVLFFRSIFGERVHPTFNLAQILVKRRIWKTAPSTWGFVLGGTVGGEISRRAFEEESQDFEEDGSQREYIS